MQNEKSLERDEGRAEVRWGQCERALKGGRLPLRFCAYFRLSEDPLPSLPSHAPPLSMCECKNEIRSQRMPTKKKSEDLKEGLFVHIFGQD